MNTTSKGISGSPLYKFHADMEKAEVIGVHVGGGRVMGNEAIPLSYHFQTADSSFKKNTKENYDGKYKLIFIR